MKKYVGDRGRWQETPPFKRWLLRWFCFNPARERDCPMRRAISGPFLYEDEEWEYASCPEVAREFLEEQYGRT